jgi:Tautomerase enzyme
MKEITDAVERTLGAPRQSIRVIIREVPPFHFAVAGEPKGPPPQEQPPVKDSPGWKWKFDFMRFVIGTLMIALLAAVATAQQTQPLPTRHTIAPKTEDIPTPSGAPEPQSIPDLLPESTELPAAPPDLRLPSPSTLKPEGSDSVQDKQVPKPLSPAEQEKNRARLAELRAIAMHNPRVIDLLKEANGALTDEAKREFMRAYYHTLCTRMRNYDSSLNETITAYEQAEIRKLAVGPSRISIVSRDILHRERQRHTRHSE